MKVLFAGGGTMGPVTPLLAVWEAWKQTDANIEGVWAGTRQGPERPVIESKKIPFFVIPKARFPRHVSFEWLWFVFSFLRAFWVSIRLLQKQKPDLVASAGGYTAVPMVLAANLLGIRIWVHHQDVALTLTTKLTVPFADLVTVAWEQNRKDLGDRVRLVGNPVRQSVLIGSKQQAYEVFNIDQQKPTLLVFGGGTGSAWINKTIDAIVPKLIDQMNVIHVTGHNKLIQAQHSDHHVSGFLDEQMADAYTVADLIVCRAGLGTITELAALSKPAIVIPLPKSPQWANANAVKDASVVLDQTNTDEDSLYETIVTHMQDVTTRSQLGEKMHHTLQTDVSEKIINLLKEL